MFCKECGTEIRNEAKFCPRCGLPTKNASESQIKNRSIPIEKKENLEMIKCAFEFGRNWYSDFDGLI